jgi:hypothetical protein
VQTLLLDRDARPVEASPNAVACVASVDYRPLRDPAVGWTGGGFTVAWVANLLPRPAIASMTVTRDGTRSAPRMIVTDASSPAIVAARGVPVFVYSHASDATGDVARVFLQAVPAAPPSPGHAADRVARVSGTTTPSSVSRTWR